MHLQIFIIEDRKYTPRNRNKEELWGKRTIKFPSQPPVQLSCLNKTNKESRTMPKQNYNHNHYNDSGEDR